MWKISKLSLILLLTLANCTRYLQFQLRRVPAVDIKHDRQPVSCKSNTTINQDAQYKQICYEKDIAYIMPFQKDGRHIAMAADFTTPISWMKGENCTIDGSSSKCKLIIETFNEKVKDLGKKIGNKFHKKSGKQEKQNAIIEGSSQIVKGELQLSQKVSFITKDSNRLTNFIDIIKLGLFMHGEKDVMTLESTNFISATSLSQNLNKLTDGAISMRLDESSQKSFLNEIFDYVKSTDKVVSVYIGQNKSLTVGDLTSKYTQQGFSSINWASTQQDQGYGLLAEITNIGIEDSSDDSDQQLDDALHTIFSLSSSYIGLPEEIIIKIAEKIKKKANCQINKSTSYLECTVTNKKNPEIFMNNHIYFTISNANLMIPLKQLVISSKGNKIVLNIKKTFNKQAILGEPVFKRYTMFFDYSKNRIGFASQRQDLTQLFNIVVLIRIICFIFVLGFSMLLCYKPCQKFFQTARSKLFSKEGGQESLRLRQYSPIQENPYEQLKGKIQDAIASTENEQS